MAFYQKLEYISVFRNLRLLNKTMKNAKSIYVKTSYKRTKEYTFFYKQHFFQLSLSAA